MLLHLVKQNQLALILHSIFSNLHVCDSHITQHGGQASESANCRNVAPSCASLRASSA